jgi:hypothetical protein
MYWNSLIHSGTMNGDRSNRMKREGPLYYRLNGRPRHAENGCWVYFIFDGYVRARSRALFADKPPKKLFSYTGMPMLVKGWHAECREMEIAEPEPKLKHKSFRGFRYVTDDEAVSFAAAFH